MKSFEVDIKGTKHPLKYTTLDAIAIKKRKFGTFEGGVTLRTLIAADALGVFHFFGVNDGANIDPEFQVAFVALGLNSGKARATPAQLRGESPWKLSFTEEAVAALFDEASGPGGQGILVPYIWPAYRAAMYSGVVNGVSQDIDEVIENVIRKLSEGKAMPSPEAAPEPETVTEPDPA